MEPSPKPKPEGPRYATLMDQMAAWLQEQQAQHAPTTKEPKP